MYKTWALASLLALGSSVAHAQDAASPAPLPVAPSHSPSSSGAPPAAPAARPEVPPAVSAPAAAAPAAVPPAVAPAAAPTPVAPASGAQRVAPVAPPQVGVETTPSAAPRAEPPAAELHRVPPPLDAAAPGAPAMRPGEVRLAPPLLYPIHRPRPPRRYGDAGAPFAFGIGASSLWRNDRGYELVVERTRTTAFELFGSYDVYAPGKLLVLAAGAAFRAEVSDASPEIEIAQHGLQADLTARLVPLRWLWPHLRVGVGFIATRFSSSDDAGDLTFEDRDRGVLGSVGAGFTLKTPTRLFETHGGRLASLSLGLLFEGGYSFASDAELRAKPRASSDIERVTFSLGTLERSAPYLRVMGVVRF